MHVTRPIRRRPSLPTLAAALACVAPAAGQVSTAHVKAEIEYARGLAADWAFVGLAREVLSHVESSGIPTEVREELDLVTCEVYATFTPSSMATVTRSCQG